MGKKRASRTTQKRAPRMVKKIDKIALHCPVAWVQLWQLFENVKPKSFCNFAIPNITNALFPPLNIMAMMIIINSTLSPSSE
jgi:hypothetical protein